MIAEVVPIDGNRERPGPTRLADGCTRFALWAPSIDSVSLEFQGAPQQLMRAAGNGWFALETAAAAGARYRFRLADGTSVPDPASRAQSGCVHDWSVVVDPAAFAWRHTAWRNRPWHEAVIYEVHAGAAGGFNGLRQRLAGLAELGFTAIELMPVADFPGARNWGYDGVLPYAPDAAYGTPDELRALVDAAHGLDLMVLLDVVYNHFGPDGAYLHGFARPFFDPDVHTAWGAAIDFTRPEVRDFFIGNALMWLNEYRFDGLRFDAVHAISPPEFLPEMAAAIRAGAVRDVHLVLEHEGNMASLLRASPRAAGYDAQWSDDFHHCLHVLLTGESEGYYGGFQNPAAQLARALAEGFVYQGEIPPGHTAPRGEPSAHLPPTAFVICLQNHDQIGNRAFGDRLTALADPQGLRAATTLLLLSPFIPLLFMGEEWGTRTPFLFFTDHNAELAPLVRDGRRREFRHFAAFQDEAVRARIPDPNDPATYRASIPDPAESATPPHTGILHLHRTLLHIRANRIMPGIPGCRSLGARAVGDRAVHAAWLLGTGSTLTLQSNFGTSPIDAACPPGKLLFTSTPAEGPILPAACTRAFLESNL
jgi:maltooligosyltrehalose trehalohydrolase